MFTEKMTKTRFTINVNFCDVINFILVLFGLGIFVTGFFTKIIVGYEFNFLLCVVSFIVVSFYFLYTYFLMYLFPNWIFTRNKK